MVKTYADCARCNTGIEYGELAGYLEEGLCCEHCMDVDSGMEDE